MFQYVLTKKGKNCPKEGGKIFYFLLQGFGENGACGLNHTLAEIGRRYATWSCVPATVVRDICQIHFIIVNLSNY